MSTLQLLKSDEHYYGAEGQKYLSNSDINTLLKDPYSFKKKGPKTVPMVEGSYFHTAALEPHKLSSFTFVDASTRNTNKYKEAAGSDVLLLESERADLDRMVDTIQGNMDFFDMVYADGAKYEEPAIGEIKGTMWKGKADVLTADYIVDLKTTSNIDDFKWSARKYNYDSQAWIYNQLFGVPLIFIVIEKKTCRTGLFECSEEFLDRGKEKVMKAIEVYNRFFAEGATEMLSQYFLRETL